MGLMKINQILKKYKGLHKKHLDSWADAQKRIRAASKEGCFPNEAVYQKESYDYQLKGNKMLDAMMKELEGRDISKEEQRCVGNFIAYNNKFLHKKNKTMSIHHNLEQITAVAKAQVLQHNCNYNIILMNPNSKGEFDSSVGSTYEMVADSYFEKERPNVVLLHKTDDLLAKRENKNSPQTKIIDKNELSACCNYPTILILNKQKQKIKHCSQCYREI